MKLKDFKEWLNQFPDDTIIEVSVERGTSYQAYSCFDEFDPDDKAKIEGLVNKRLAPFQEKIIDATIESDLQNELAKHPEFKEYEGRIRSYVNHPSRKDFIKQGLPVSSVVYEAVAPYLMRAGAKAERVASKKAKDSQVNNNGGGNDKNNSVKDWSKASSDDVAAKRAEIFGQNN